MKTNYLTPELRKEELYLSDAITASGEPSGSESSEEPKRREVDNAFRLFGDLRG